MPNQKTPPYAGVGVYVENNFYFATKCALCDNMVIADPDTAVSVRLPEDPNTRRAICPHCVARCNAERVRQGMKPVPLDPNAYKTLEELNDG